MKFEIAVVLVYSTLVMSFNTDVRIKRQILKMPSPLTGLGNNAISNLGSSLASGLASTTSDMIQKGVSKVVSSGTDIIGRGVSDMENAVNNIATMGLEGVKAVGSRIEGALKNTYHEEKDSFKSSWDSVKNMMINGIEAGANLTKTGFDLGTIGPKLGKNLILG
ncbi:uncharacterized protein LOC100679800 [Nasonia vitripennis]|uniref:Uncharacterized protein n=1 Tax=Nasonia vitripennis TaxID=7425 RepID=A0A7M7GDW1_NASVI|nr:uncharacterized protein LOC100679800 [Nasonia vitripennis]